MKKILFVLMSLVSILCVSCDDEPKMPKNEQECAITYIENTVIKNHLDYGDVIYKITDFSSSLEFELYEYDDFSYPYDRTKSNLKTNYYMNKLKNQLCSDLDLNNLYHNGHSTCTVAKNGRWETMSHHYFSTSKFGDEINFKTDPDARYGFVTVTIKCNHKHPVKQLHN